ncbi:MAG: CDP-alcohol phosphatidyltransferase [Bacteroidales bacterium]|jgi:phosphatidylglycerophosphate synthase|nr:CDP-alcohol phosphatidyltransferase [Bacteroidales bacterium]MDD2570611.1 CDP-alcohol phosphatidyltransferase [Bacteroidales bacterium]MDD2812400.1 CDP-alcohol phosphatidyltransferase [Bacteroidales bacterium]MDD3385722.1 CDP-alcohol phosphatidyltransferase [Bacteroidales bacterium]MDD3810756.1 CDP-alcohol phosphatidyltransferase [Bacteroidales bacterium]
MKTLNRKPHSNEKKRLVELISHDRTRTNLLRTGERNLIIYLVQRIPQWMTSNMLTGIGLIGNIIVMISFLLATFIDRNYLLLGIPGFVINWFGDSLDGRLAYYRNRPKKLYGFTLDITIDWIGIILIGVGFIVYAEGVWELIGYGFVVMYGWEMIVALMRLRLTGNYSIDFFKVGPTEVRIVLILVLITELLLPDSIRYFALLVCIILFIVNIIDTHNLLRIAENMDLKERNQSEGK